MSTSYALWCSHCPTRVTVETDADDAPARDNARLLGLETRTTVPCPRCGGELLDLDELVRSGAVPPRTRHVASHHARIRQTPACWPRSPRGAVRVVPTFHAVSDEEHDAAISAERRAERRRVERLLARRDRCG